jgi:hypothetical protein
MNTTLRRHAYSSRRLEIMPFIVAVPLVEHTQIEMLLDDAVDGVLETTRARSDKRTTAGSSCPAADRMACSAPSALLTTTSAASSIPDAR